MSYVKIALPSAHKQQISLVRTVVIETFTRIIEFISNSLRVVLILRWILFTNNLNYVPMKNLIEGFEINNQEEPGNSGSDGRSSSGSSSGGGRGRSSRGGGNRSSSRGQSKSSSGGRGKSKSSSSSRSRSSR
jgi:hypothetical protein